MNKYIKKGSIMDNSSSQYYVIFETRAGWIGILSSSQGISRTTLPQKSQESVSLAFGKDLRHAQFSPEYFSQLITAFKEYFLGSNVGFSANLNFSRITDFERAVYETTQSIPYGETRSYGWVARQIDKPLAYRAVGTALGKNPWPIVVPCHRVLGSDGSLHGFGGGLELKQYLLDLEKNGLKLS